jgi:hypothetical protein
MAQFDQLQDLWQGQAGPAVSPEEALRVARSVRGYARRQRLIGAGKAVVIAAVLAGSIVRSQGNVPAIAGLALVGLAAAALLIRDWRDQRALERLDFSAPSVGFVRATIGRLLAQRDPFRRYYWPFMGAAVLATNLALAQTHRLWLRVVFSGLPFVAFEAGLWVRRKRFEAECRPVIDQLSALRSALEERPE